MSDDDTSSRSDGFATKSTIVATASVNGRSKDDPGEELSQCLLSQYRFCVAGVGLGAAYAVKFRRGPPGTKGAAYLPLLAGGVAGTFADMIYGYTVACADEAERFNRSREERVWGPFSSGGSNAGGGPRPAGAGKERSDVGGHPAGDGDSEGWSRG